MSGRKDTTVECVVCNTDFDPTAAGGWCTNPECGEWRYEGEERDGDTADDDHGEPDSSGVSSGTGEEGQDRTPEGQSGEDGMDAEDATGVEDEMDVEDATSVEEEMGGEAEEVDDQTDGEPEEVDEEAGGTEESPVERGTDTPTPEMSCPGCGETLDADANFCPSCGEDVSAIEQAEDDAELTACPACGDSVDAEDNFCANCGENLDEHRDTEPLTACPTCGTKVDDEDSFCADCGENLDEHRDEEVRNAPTGEEPPETQAATGDGDEPATTPAGSDSQETQSGTETESTGTPAAPSSLLLETRGREVAVTDGETVGRELRKILTETGGDENDAVRVHREHIRFVREDEQFYLVNLGKNPTEINGRALDKGDRVAVSPEDEISLSGVVTLTVAYP